jgi:hypothetical protein
MEDMRLLDIGPRSGTSFWDFHLSSFPGRIGKKVLLILASVSLLAICSLCGPVVSMTVQSRSTT